MCRTCGVRSKRRAPESRTPPPRPGWPGADLFTSASLGRVERARVRLARACAVGRVRTRSSSDKIGRLRLTSWNYIGQDAKRFYDGAFEVMSGIGSARQSASQQLTAVGPRTTSPCVCRRTMPVQCLPSGAARGGQLLRAAVGKCSTGAAAKKGGASPTGKRCYLLLPSTNESDRHAGYPLARRTLFWLRSSGDSLARLLPKRPSLPPALRTDRPAQTVNRKDRSAKSPGRKRVLDEAKNSA